MTTSAPDSKELFARLQDYRRKVVRGEPVTDEELRQAISDLHAYRAGAHTSLEAAANKKGKKETAAKAKAKAKQEAQNLLGGLL